MKLKVMKFHNEGSFRVRMAMGLQMRLTIAPAGFLSTWELSCHLDSQSTHVAFSLHCRVQDIR